MGRQCGRVKIIYKRSGQIDQNIQFKEEIGGKEINYLDLNIKINEERKLEFDIFKKEMYSDIIIPSESYHPYKCKMAAINAFCYRASKCLKNKNKEKEERRIKNIVKNNNYKTKLVDIIMKNMNVKNYLKKLRRE